MLQIKKYMLGLLLCGLAACSKDNIQPPVDRATVPRNMGVFIENNYDLSLLHAALKKTGLYDSLLTTGPYTLFAPDNAAFNQIGIATVAAVENMNTDSLRQMLKYHMMRGRYFTNMFPLQLDVKYPTVADKDIYVSLDITPSIFNPAERTISINGSVVSPYTKRDLALANGVIHVINKPLQYNEQTVQDFVAADTSLTFFRAAMEKFGMWNDMKTKSPLTIFAPNNAAFRSYDLSIEKIKAMNPADYQPATFSIYTLNMRPMHMFSTDGYLISKTNVYGANIAVIDSIYGLSPNFEGLTTITANVAIMNQQQGFWIGNAYGPSTVNYLNGLSGADHLCSNGIVHIVTDLFFRPDLMKR